VSAREAIFNRRSVRRFMSRPIPEEAIGVLLEAACRAPSAGNLQPWFFYVVEDKSKREQLARAALGQGFIASAPLCIVVCAIPKQSARVYGERGAHLYCLQDTAAAVQNILLAAVDLGLGACWVGAFDENEVSRVLKMPPEHRPVAIIPVGYPVAETSAPTPRRSVNEVCARV